MFCLLSEINILLQLLRNILKLHLNADEFEVVECAGSKSQRCPAGLNGSCFTIRETGEVIRMEEKRVNDREEAQRIADAGHDMQRYYTAAFCNLEINSKFF